jgi:hypothetical protein
LGDAGYQVRTTPPGDGIKEWSVIASGDPDALDIATAEDEGFIPLAEALGGEYDGNEIRSVRSSGTALTLPVHRR